MAHAPETFQGTQRFQVLHRLGAGGAGVVFEVYDREQQARVALKTLQALHPNALLRFKAEFRALQDLRHPNLVRLGELFEEDGQWFFTMEYVDGVDFLEYVRTDAEGAAKSEDDPTDEITAPPLVSGAPVPRPAPRMARASFDERRLRNALAQLARALVALHATGKVHRDVKPSNVLVTVGELSDSSTGARDRVVVLDFGLVLELERTDLHVTFHDEVVGTVGYMAPEQAAGDIVGPAADWYAVGAVLYRALTGRLPFGGPAHEVLSQKRSMEPPPPSAVAPGVPEDLDALCRDLLRLDPRARPTGAEVLKRLRHSSMQIEEPSTTTASMPPPGRVPPFVGRAEELALLDEAFHDTREGRATTVCIVGESGLGKTALARTFCDRVAQQHKAIVLTGRCHERESVRFKGVDGLVDGLARVLGKLPRVDAAAVVPRHAVLLTQIFPVLARVDALASAPTPRGEAVDPLQQRAQAFAAMRELLGRLAERRPLVLFVDDLQWSDADGVALLREVMREPEAPPLLLVTTARPGTTSARGIAENARTLELSPLRREESEELARRLLVGASAKPGVASIIAEEAGGHPFFIDTLVRHDLATGDTGQRRRRLALDEALWARIERLDPEARDVVECVAVAESPLAQDAVAYAVGVDFADLATRAWGLRLENLVRLSGVRRHDTIEPFHDRVRDAVLGHMHPESRRRWHERLARTLEKSLEGTGRADVTALALHWKGAGDARRAATYAHVAAEQASNALAFDRAAGLHRMVIDLAPDDPEAVRSARAKLGDALANAGRGLEAAEAYLSAASGAPAAEGFDLRRRATEQLLISGHIDRGLDTLSAVLAELDMSIPKSPRSALTSLVFRRAQIRLRGLDFQERGEDQVPPEVLQRIDVCWAASRSLGMVDNIRGADFQTRHLLLALDAGEPHRVLRAILLEVGFSAASGSKTHKRTAKLVAMAEALGRRLETPLAKSVVEGAEGFAAFLEGRWKRALERLTRADEILRDRCTGVVYERDTITMYRMACLVYLGELAELGRVLPRIQRESMERGDLYASTNLRTGLMTLARLAEDDPETARRDADDAIAQWSTRGVHVPHFLDVQAQAQIDLYAGEPKRALDRIRARWKELDKAMLMRVQYIRLTMLYLRARAALATAMTTGDAAMLDEAWEQARAMDKEGPTWAEGCGHVVRGTVAFVRGDRVAAAEALTEAERAFAASDMALHAASARHHRGVATGDEASREEGLDVLRRQAIEEPERWMQMLAPFPVVR